jgi:hypothetical protein
MSSDFITPTLQRSPDPKGVRDARADDGRREAERELVYPSDAAPRDHDAVADPQRGKEVSDEWEHKA